jgi:hypothetical protein
MASRRRESVSTSTRWRGRDATPGMRTRWTWSCLLLLVVACMMPVSSAASRRTASWAAIPTDALVVDSQVVPVKIDGAWQWVHQSEVELRKRQEASQPASITPSRTTRGQSQPTSDGDSASDDETEDDLESDADVDRSTNTTSATPTSTKAGDPSLNEPSPLPSPFDNNLDFNFTSNGGKSCPVYLNNLLTSAQFKACYPLSMLLQVRPRPHHFPCPTMC